MVKFDFIPLDEKTELWFETQQKQHLYLSYSWLKTQQLTYGFEILLVVDTKGQYQTAFCKLNDMMGKRLISLPFSDYLPFGEMNSAHVEQLFTVCADRFPGYTIILKTDIDKQVLEKGFNLQKEAVYHTISLTAVNKLKQSSSFTRGVKQAKKNGLHTRINTSMIGLVEFYRIYHRLRFDKFGIIPQPFSFFENLFEEFRKEGNIVIFEALLGEKVIASMIILKQGKTAYYKYGCSDLEHLTLKPNNILFHDLIKHFKEQNLENIDLGLSGAGENYAGLRRWKSSMGGIEKPITYWSLDSKENEASNELIETNKKKIRGLTDAIVRSDLGPQETSALSEQIYPLLA